VTHPPLEFADLSLFEVMEAALFDELPPIADTHPVLVLTTNGMREWIVYAKVHEWLPSWAPRFQERLMKDQPGKVDANIEPSWQTFLDWTSA